MVNDASRVTMGAQYPLEFPMAEFQAQVETLRLSNQQFKFSVHELSLHDGREMSGAFADALRTSVHELPSNQLKEMLGGWFVECGGQAGWLACTACPRTSGA